MICPDLVKSRFEKSFASYDAHAAVQADISGELFAQWQRRQPQAGRLLELGCGTGGLTRRLAGLPGLEVQWVNDLPGLLGRCAGSLKRSGWLALSSFGPQHYAEIKALTGIGLTYYPLEQYRDWLAPQFDIVWAQEYHRRLLFEQPAAVLAHMRHTGVSGVQRTPWDRRRLQAFEADYAAHFGSAAGVPLTYHPLLLLARKK